MDLQLSRDLSLTLGRPLRQLGARSAEVPANELTHQGGSVAAYLIRSRSKVAPVLIQDADLARRRVGLLLRHVCKVAVCSYSRQYALPTRSNENSPCGPLACSYRSVPLCSYTAAPETEQPREVREHQAGPRPSPLHYKGVQL